MKCFRYECRSCQAGLDSSRPDSRLSQSGLSEPAQSRASTKGLILCWCECTIRRPNPYFDSRLEHGMMTLKSLLKIALSRSAVYRRCRTKMRGSDVQNSQDMQRSHLKACRWDSRHRTRRQMLLNMFRLNKICTRSCLLNLRIGLATRSSLLDLRIGLAHRVHRRRSWCIPKHQLPSTCRRCTWSRCRR